MVLTHHEKDAMDNIHASPLNLVDENQIEDDFKFNIIDIPAMIIFWTLVIIVFLQFFTRYFLNNSLDWTEEASRYLLILLGFVGAVTVARKGGHIFLEFFYRFIKDSHIKILVITSQLCCIAFYGYCAYLSTQVAERITQSLISLPIPKNSIYWIISICFSLMALHSLILAYEKIMQPSDEVSKKINAQVLSNQG